MKFLQLNGIKRRVDDAIQAERERCLDAVRYVYALRGSDLLLVYKLIESGRSRKGSAAIGIQRKADTLAMVITALHPLTDGSDRALARRNLARIETAELIAAALLEERGLKS